MSKYTVSSSKSQSSYSTAWFDQLRNAISAKPFKKLLLTKATLLNEIFCESPTWEEKIHFKEDLLKKIKPLTDKLNQGLRCRAMISGLRRSGKTTYLKLLSLNSIDLIQKHGLFLFFFDLSKFLDGTYWDMMFMPWLEAFFDQLQCQIEMEKTNYSTLKYEIIHILKGRFSNPKKEFIAESYKALFTSVKIITECFGFKDIIYLLDEFERSFPKIDIKGDENITLQSFNVILKNIIDALPFEHYFVITGTDAVQIGISCGSCPGLNGGTPLITRCLSGSLYTTSLTVSYDSFEKEFKRVNPSKQIDWPIIHGEKMTYDAFGHIAAYLKFFLYDNPIDALDKLKSTILSQINQDFIYLDNIQFYKRYKNYHSLEDFQEKMKTDMLLLLYNQSPEYFNIESMGMKQYFKDIHMNVYIYGIILKDYLKAEKHQLTRRVAMQLETHPYGLGWKIKDACKEHLQVTSSLNRNYYSINSLSERMTHSLIEWNSSETIDFSALTEELKLYPNILYFDTGKAGDSTVQQYLPAGIDSICGGPIQIEKIKIDVTRIKSSSLLRNGSIFNTIAKFILPRTELQNESVLSRFLILSYNAIQPHVYLNLTLSNNQNKIIKITREITAKDLKQDFQKSKNIGLITFNWNQQGQLITGEVNLIMLVFGSIDLYLVKKYSGICFVWGSRSLKEFIGNEMMESLKSNERFRLISIFQNDNKYQYPYDKLAKIENFQHITVNGEVYFCLQNTPIDVIKTFWVKKRKLLSYSMFDFIQEWTFQFNVKIKTVYENQPNLPEESQHSRKRKFDLKDSREDDPDYGSLSEEDFDSFSDE